MHAFSCRQGCPGSLVGHHGGAIGQIFAHSINQILRHFSIVTTIEAIWMHAHLLLLLPWSSPLLDSIITAYDLQLDDEATSRPKFILSGLASLERPRDSRLDEHLEPCLPNGLHVKISKPTFLCHFLIFPSFRSMRFRCMS